MVDSVKFLKLRTSMRLIESSNLVVVEFAPCVVKRKDSVAFLCQVCSRDIFAVIVF